jgi:hypothetical protein
MRPRFSRRYARALPGARYARALAGVVVILLAIGAFLARGPIGLGNGPLSFGSFSISGIPDPGGAPIGLVVPVINHGKSAALINGITRVGGGGGYPPPRLITSYGADDQGCAGLTRLTRPGQATGCATGHLALQGMAFPPSRKVRDRVSGHLVAVASLGVIAEAAAPAAGRCWTVKAIAVHYHVGIRHYTATTPEAGAACGSGVSSMDLQDAMSSVGR